MISTSASDKTVFVALFLSVLMSFDLVDKWSQNKATILGNGSLHSSDLGKEPW